MGSKDKWLANHVKQIKTELATAFIHKDEKSVFRRIDIDNYVDKVAERFALSSDRCNRILLDKIIKIIYTRVRR